MRDLHASELAFVYGAGGGGKGCNPPPCSKQGDGRKHGSNKHNSNGHGSRGHSGHCG